MIYKSISVLIASLLLFSSSGKGDTKPQVRSSTAMRADVSHSIFTTAWTVGSVETFCKMTELKIIPRLDASVYIGALIVGVSKREYDSVKTAMSILRVNTPDCFQLIPTKLLPKQ